MIAWRNRKQTSVALNTTEAEYIAACSTSSKVVWLRKMLARLFDLEMDATCIYYDKSKHIEIKYQYIRDMVEKGVVKLQYVSTNE